MGYRIAITGAVIFIFFLLLGMLANSPPKQQDLVRVFGVIMLVGMFMFPAGIIIEIWSAN